MAEDQPDSDRPSSEPLELREARYRTLFESSRSVLWAADPAGRFRSGQREWQRFTGLSLEEQKGFGWMDAIHPDDRGRFVQAWAEARASTEVFVSEVRIWSAPHDEYRECELRSAPLMIADGQRVREWVGHLIDVSELRRAQAAVHERDIMLSALVENAPIPIFVKDREGYYVLASQHVTEMLTGDPEASLIGRSDEELLPWRVAKQVRAHDEEVCRSGEIRVFEEMVPASGGADRWWLTTKFPLPSPSGSGPSLAGIAVDVTERRKLAEERAEAIRRRDDFLAMLSHELRNPMQAILHAVRMVDAESADTSQEAKAIIRRQAHHVSRMLADLLDVSRMVHGRINLASDKVSIERVVDAAVETVRPLASAAGTALEVQKGTGRVRGDETRLVQVVVNLLRNAVSHSRQNDPIQLSVLTDDESLSIEVSDSGAGIDPDELERIFDPFYQREQSIARSEGGLGLGLSLGRTLAELHGGTLTAESEGPGHGARFTLTLPRLPETDSRPASPTPPAPERESGVLTFVVVEDNDDSREMLALWLRSRGHTVIPCADGETGLEAILERRPDVAIVDLGLPGLDGYDVAKAVRERWEGPALRLVAVTGYGREEDRRRVMEAGFDAHLVKPVEVEVLERLLVSDEVES
ncbi:MAG: PAS domain-containing protein [Deltaproteobacteria bacterium]|nr:PAS domain-containing protein [Deltaproteobacteria bacterium]